MMTTLSTGWKPFCGVTSRIVKGKVHKVCACACRGGNAKKKEEEEAWSLVGKRREMMEDAEEEASEEPG